jgi:hypothetical protein
VLEAAALERPLLVALDDLQFADAGTLVALRALVPRTVGLPIRWMFALRPGEARTELRELLSRLEDARRLPLGPLCEAAVAAVVADPLFAPGEPAVLRLAASAHGNPPSCLSSSPPCSTGGRRSCSGRSTRRCAPTCCRNAATISASVTTGCARPSCGR